MTKYKHEVTLKILGNNECSRKYAGRVNTNQQFCAGRTGDNKDTCQGE